MQSWEMPYDLTGLEPKTKNLNTSITLSSSKSRTAIITNYCGPNLKLGPKHSWCTSCSVQYLKLSQCNNICLDIQLYHNGGNFWFRQCLQLHHQELLGGVQILVCSIKKKNLNIFEEEASWNRGHHCTIKITGCQVLKFWHSCNDR